MLSARDSVLSSLSCQVLLVLEPSPPFSRKETYREATSWRNPWWLAFILLAATCRLFEFLTRALALSLFYLLRLDFSDVIEEFSGQGSALILLLRRGGSVMELRF